MKMSKNKKKITQLDIWKGIRKIWTVNPVTKIKPNKKKKSRSQTNIDFKREMRDEI